MSKIQVIVVVTRYVRELAVITYDDTDKDMDDIEVIDVLKEIESRDVEIVNFIETL